ncbi:MAG TPA: cysteine--tRNA ligase [Deltaproteobacteria bacterium]|nr:cysteine--tRNA ligase [Deltaproteobacteria bacterium]
MTIRVYNTLTGTKEPFEPADRDDVKMYVCGPTVYALSHIGHARSAVAFDVIFRYLRYRGYGVTYTRNYTDIDDKIINRARELRTDWRALAEENIRAFDEDMAALGVELPTIRPRATESIKTIIATIETLIDKGYAYAAGGDVFYSVRRFQSYGALSGKRIDELEAGARIEVDERKKDPLDFALWKASKPDEPAWESPWGPGRPGWHIECSAMCLEHLGEQIDIHGGGKDLVFPHHENEIAQSEAATGRSPFARYWLHNGFVNIESEKMSKSLGNILNIRDALREHSGEALRLFLLSSHYRSPIDYSAETLREAEAKLERFYTTMERLARECPQAVDAPVDDDVAALRLKPLEDAMDDDFNTAAAIGRIFEAVAVMNRMLDGARGGRLPAEESAALALVRTVIARFAPVLGVFTRTPEEYRAERRAKAAVDAAEIERLIAERAEARRRKDFKRADAIRDELAAMGVTLKDTPTGTTWST